MIQFYSKKIFQLTCLLIIIFTSNSFAQNATVQIDANCQRYIGEVSELDRTKFFSVHDTGSDADQTKFRNDYNVTGGRGFWGPFSYAKSKTGSAGVYPSFKTGNDAVKNVKGKFIATEHPNSAFIDGLNASIAADWAVEYFKDFANDDGRNEYFEVMNEPFVHANEFYDGWSASENDRIKLQMAKFYNEVGKKFNETPALANMKVIGYSSAWPSMELNDFGHWEENMKMFMDNAGANMYGFSTHLYDGINVTGQDTKRSGSNSEAILDLIENYSFIKWGVVKPHAISEYGAIESGYEEGVYSEIASSQTLRSVNHILLNLLDREDRITTSIPFITGKATWHINAANNYQPYGAVLWIPSNIGQPTPTGWHYSPRIYFYDLWKDVKGKRVLIKSDNPDVQVHAFANNTKMYVALSNLDESNQTVNLTMLSSITDLVDVKIKALKIYDNAMPNFSIETVNKAPESITLIKDETVMLEYTFNTLITFNNSLRTNNYYTNNDLETIKTNTAITYNFNNVTTGDGFATLRMSIGRKHNVSKQPIIKVNGTTLTIPSNWKGYDQANRDDFFGMIEIPFSAQLLQSNNTVTVEFPDNGGKISSLILSVDIFDKAKSTLSVQSVGNPCPNVGKGIITINPLISDNYNVHITGPSLDNTYNFSNLYNIENLASGKYNIVITSTTNLDFKDEYNIQISEPENLSVSSKLSSGGKTVTYNLKGGNSYAIKINSEIYKTSNSTIKLPLINGKNIIEIRSEKNCQGIYNDELFIGNEITAYPNPFTNSINIDLGLDSSTNALVSIYNTQGVLIYSKNETINGNNIYLNTSYLNKGVYILSVNTLLSSKKIKIFK